MDVVDSRRFLFFNIYMSCDNRSQYNPTYSEVLHSINPVINQHSDIGHTVIEGDLNNISRVRSSYTRPTALN